MLNEPRKKVRYSTNPNGNQWAEDSSGFGRKMLERLGWSSGSGLGKDGNGISSVIKPVTQTSKKGLGMNTAYSLGGEKQLEDYAELLKSLNNAYSSGTSSKSTPSAPKGLEEISKSNRFKCKPSKFIRAKDSSKYDPKSLAIILGQTDRLDRSTKPKKETEPLDNVDKAFGVKTVSSTLSMTEYFRKRKAELSLSKDLSEKLPRLQPLTHSDNADSSVLSEPTQVTEESTLSSEIT